MHKKILICLLMLIAASASAQTHNTNCMRCKLSKNYIGKLTKEQLKGSALNECGCAACHEKDKKEREAKQAEDKRRADAAAAKYKAAKEAKDKAFANAQNKKKEEAKSGQVEINAQPNSAPGKISKSSPLVKTQLDFSKKDNTKSKLFPLNTYKNGKRCGMIVNQNGDTIVNKTGSDYLNEVSDWNDNNTYFFKKRQDYVKAGYSDLVYNKINIISDEIPTNAVIVTLSDYSKNIMDSKGNLLLDEENISLVFYCGNEFFVYFTSNPEIPSDCFVNDYYYSGSKMIVFDHKLNKKYTFAPDPNADNSLHFNRRYQISGYRSEFADQDFLFYWIHFTDTGEDDGGYIITEDEHIKIDKNRTPVKITTIKRKSSFWK